MQKNGGLKVLIPKGGFSSWVLQIQTAAAGSRLGVDFIFHAVAFAFYDHRLCMVKQAVEESGGQCSVMIENFRPVLICPVRSNDERAAFIALTYDLKKQVSSGFIDGQVTQFVQDEQ